MKIGIYSIFDKVAAEFGPIFSAKNDEVASRMFRDTEVRDQIKNIEDFELHRAGWYDNEQRDSAGNIEISYDPMIVNVKSWKAQELID